MTISLQQWLAVRLDLFGNVLVLGIGLFAAGFRRSIEPSKVGVVLTYTLSSKFHRDFIQDLSLTIFAKSHRSFVSFLSFELRKPRSHLPNSPNGRPICTERAEHECR
jgi:hypothetical protein